MPISQYTSGKYGDSSNNNGSSSSYYSRSRDSASERGRERDKDWSSSGSSRGREWRRGERERSRDRERDKDRQRSPSRTSRFTSDYNSNSSRDRGERRQQEKYYSSAASARSPPPAAAEEPVARRASRFATSGTGKYSDIRSGYSGPSTSTSYSTVPTVAGTSTSLIREKDLLQNPGLTSSILHGDQYGSYHFSSQSHFADFPSYSTLGQTTSSQEKDSKDDPLFKAAVDALIMNMKTRGDYDQVRKECFSDIDTKAAFINLHARIKTTADKFLGLQTFTKDMDKVKTREGMRRKILETPYFEKGIESVVSQILTPKINALIRPKVEEEVSKYLKTDKNGDSDMLQNNLSNNNEPVENHIKHESIQTREIMPNSPIFKDKSDKPRRLLSTKIIGLAEPFEDATPSPSSQEPYQVAPSVDHSTVTRDSDMSESSSEKSLEIDLDARSEMMDESSGTTRQDEGGPTTPTDPETSSVLPDTRVPPPPPPPPPPPMSVSTPSSSISVNTTIPCSMPTMSIAPPYGPPPVAFGGHIAHFGLGVLPPTHGIMEHSLSLGSISHAAGIPPPLPPLPPSGNEHPPPPPSPPKPQLPPPPPPLCDDDACSSPPGGSMLIPNDEEDEPLPPGEEPDSYFSQMRSSKVLSPPKPEDKPDMPPPPPPPEPIEVDLASIRLPGEDSEEVESLEEEDEVEDDDSEEESPMFEKIDEVSPPRVVLDSEEEESPMFEKICEVSPPRPVELQNNPLVQELRKELLGEDIDTTRNEEEENPDPTTLAITLPERRISNSSRSSNSCSSNECKYLETIPEIDYKVSFYKRIPDS